LNPLSLIYESVTYCTDGTPHTPRLVNGKKDAITGGGVAVEPQNGTGKTRMCSFPIPDKLLNEAK